MKTLLSFVLFFSISLTITAQKLTVGTFNIRLETKNDTGNLWTQRAPLVSDLIRFYDFDILGTQEGFANQLQDIKTALPYYSVYGKGRNDGKTAGEHTAIFYKKDKFELLNQGDFWLSETPDKPSIGWDGKCCNRITSWIYLKHKKSKKSFYVFNTHFDHEGQIARRESSKFILKKIAEIAGNKPTILMGDFNGNHNSEPYKILAESKLLKDTYQLAEFPYANNNSFNGFGKTLKGSNIIDHVFVTPQFNVKKWGILSDSFQGKFPSDHFPVLVELKMK
ncbi:MAG TPA: endonuclease/exonuclease/phosphatase family protein [Pelobium sp.]|nr:endonuclease/exonuclease/phosphatase family protein [Pelobium sp.]